MRKKDPQAIDVWMTAMYEAGNSLLDKATTLREMAADDSWPERLETHAHTIFNELEDVSTTFEPGSYRHMPTFAEEQPSLEENLACFYQEYLNHKMGETHPASIHLDWSDPEAIRQYIHVLFQESTPPGTRWNEDVTTEELLDAAQDAYATVGTLRCKLRHE